MHLLRVVTALLRYRLPKLLARRMFVWTFLLAFVVLFWTVLHWDQWAAALAGLPPWQTGILGWFVVMGMRPNVEEIAAPPMWWRLLPGSWARALVVLPLMAVAGGPLWAGAILWPGVMLWRCLTWVLLLTWLSLRRDMLGYTLGILLSILMEYQMALGGVLTGFALIRGIPLAFPEAHPRLTASKLLIFARGTLSAAFIRDALILWRQARDLGGWALALMVPAGLLAWGLQVNGGLKGESLGRALSVLRCVLSPLGAIAIARLLGQGRRADPPTWPLSAAGRVGVWAVLALILLLPVDVAMAATGPDIGHPGVALWGGSALGLAIVAAWEGARALSDRWYRYNIGVYLLWTLGILGLVLCPLWWSLGGLGVLGGLLSMDAVRHIKAGRRRDGEQA